MNNSTTAAATTTSGFPTGIIIGAIILIVYILIILVLIESVWRLYSKAGKPGWTSLIPFYNTIVKLEIIGRPIWWFVIMMFVPLIGLWFEIVATLDFAKSYGKSTGFGILLFLVPIVGYPLLAFNKSTQYIGPVAEGLSGFTPASSRGPTPGSPTSSFTTPPAFVPPAPAPVGANPVTAPSPFMTTDPTASAAPVAPVVPVIPDQSPAAAAPMQSSIDELVAENLPPIVEPAPVIVPPLVVPPVAPADPVAASDDPGQPTPPQL